MDRKGITALGKSLRPPITDEVIVKKEVLSTLTAVVSSDVDKKGISALIPKFLRGGQPMFGGLLSVELPEFVTKCLGRIEDFLETPGIYNIQVKLHVMACGHSVSIPL